MDLSSSDKEILNGINNKIISFIKSNEDSLQMEPMNSYHRRMIHKISKKYKLRSESDGEGENRYVNLTKTSLTSLPKNVNEDNMIDRGIEIFYAKPGAEIILRRDGSFGVYMEEQKENIIDRRIINEGEFRIRKNKIICNQDSNW